jgi:tetratricopeptide (TPR) repeat protein
VWVAALLVAVLAGGWWYLQLGQRSATPSVQTASVQMAPELPKLKAVVPLAAVPADTGLIKSPAAVASVPVTVPGKVAIATAKVPKPVVTAPPVVAKAVDDKSVAAPALVPRLLPRVEAPVAGVVPDTATGNLRMESSLMRLPSSQKVTPQPAVTPQAVVVRPAALDALAQAQRLWNAGSHTAATELLSQALSRVESSTASGAPVAGQSALASLARELARMQLADGQVGQALALLKRLEPQLTQVADVWAMRGNAAQRLGQHAEAAQSYQKALALRPDESRWMLGAAVSLAAQGQTVAAGELADKARSMGALRPEVANYLRQLGVVIRTD